MTGSFIKCKLFYGGIHIW